MSIEFYVPLEQRLLNIEEKKRKRIICEEILYLDTMIGRDSAIRCRFSHAHRLHPIRIINLTKCIVRRSTCLLLFPVLKNACLPTWFLRISDENIVLA